MPNNIRRHLQIAGATTGAAGNSVFISKAGITANDAFTPDTTKPSITANNTLAKTHVFIAEGDYIATGNLAVSASGPTTRYYGDGKVVIDMQGFDINCGQYASFDNITLINVGKLNLMQFGAGGSGFVSNKSEFVFLNKSAKNITYPDTRNYQIVFQNSIIRNGWFEETNGRWIEVLNCLLYNTDLINIITCYGDFISLDSKVRKVASVISNTNGATITGTYDNNNVNGQIALGSDAFKSLEQYKIDYPSSNQNSINVDGGFQSEFTGNYTLKITSPHIIKDIGPKHLRLSNSLYLRGPVGAVGAGSGHYLEDVATNATYQIIAASNIVATEQAGQLRFKVIESVGGSLEGWYKTAPIQINYTPQSITGLFFAFGINRNTDFPALETQFDPNNPQPLNNNVPNNDNYVSGHAGRNPNRSKTGMRWSNKENPQDAVNTDWITGVNFLLFNLFGDCQYNPVTLIGDGSPDFLLASQTTAENAPTNPQATWVQFFVKIINNNFSK